ncbi:MAG: hypothetical protein Q9169_004787 [Polycauliona sp. 2 TL-2023]
MESIFGRKKSKVPVTLQGHTKARFDSSILKRAVTKVITDHGLAERELFDNGKTRGCRVFVCATSSETTGIKRLRSYNLPEELNVRPTICDAALATSAATSFFEPVQIGSRTKPQTYGALLMRSSSSPSSSAFCPSEPVIPERRQLKQALERFLTGTLVDIATETENTAESVIGRWRNQYEQKKYFRFNVQQGLQGIGLEEYREQATIETATDEYLQGIEQKSQVRDCIENLVQKKCSTDSNFASVVRGHVTRRTIALHISMGGLGKSELCLQLAHRVRQRFWGVFWVDVSTTILAEIDFLRITSSLGFPVESMEEARQCLANVKESWLLVLDNADDHNVDYQRYFPTGPLSVVIMTSRNPDCGQLATTKSVELEELQEEDARRLLLATSKTSPHQYDVVQADA